MDVPITSVVQSSGSGGGAMSEGGRSTHVRPERGWLFPATAGGTGSSATVVVVLLVDVLVEGIGFVDVVDELVVVVLGMVVLVVVVLVVVVLVVVVLVVVVLVVVVLVVVVLVVDALATTVGSVDATVGSESTGDRVHAATRTSATINVLRPTGRLSQVGHRVRPRAAGRSTTHGSRSCTVTGLGESALGESARCGPD
jgi:hypothetical protein